MNQLAGLLGTLRPIHSVFSLSTFCCPQFLIAPCTAPYFLDSLRSPSGAAPQARGDTSTRPSDGDLAQYLNTFVGRTRQRQYAGNWWTVRCAPESTLRIEAKASLHARTNLPVSRVSGIGVEGVERQGCRERRKGPGTALVRRPLERRWNERTRNEAQRSAGPNVGGAFSLLTFSLRKQRESEAPCRAQPVATTWESAKGLLRAISAGAQI